jgi:hypothetical protein
MDWWTNAETFHASPFANDWGQNGHFDWATLAQSKFTFTTHCPIDKNFIDRCHQMGIRCFPYISFYFGADNCQFGPISSNTYEGVDFSMHPDFIERDQQGNPKPWVFSNTTPDGVGVTFSNPPLLNAPAPDLPYLMCPNYEPYQKKMIAWVNYIMQQGADGIFVDNLAKRTHCYAQHPGPNPNPNPTPISIPGPIATPPPNPNQNHIYPDNPGDLDVAQNQAFELLLSRVRQVVMSYRPDGLVIGNSGDPLNLTPGQSWPGFQQYLDADTLEGYVASGSSSWQGKLSWEFLGQKLQAYLAQGKQVLAISGLRARGRPRRTRSFAKTPSCLIAPLAWPVSHGTPAQ